MEIPPSGSLSFFPQHAGIEIPHPRGRLQPQRAVRGDAAAAAGDRRAALLDGEPPPARASRGRPARAAISSGDDAIAA